MLIKQSLCKPLKSIPILTLILVVAPMDWLIAPADAQASRPDAVAPVPSPGGATVDPLTPVGPSDGAMKSAPVTVCGKD